MLWRHRGLIAELARREFAARYRGSFGGVLWSFAQPVFMLAVYTLAFGAMLQVRWGASGRTEEYAFMLFAGLLVFNAFSECLRRAPNLVTANPNFVKKVVFPLEVLPWVMALGAVGHAVLGTVVWLVGYTILFGVPHPTSVCCLLVLAAFFPALLGIGWLLSAWGVFIRDIGQVAELLSHALLFLTPVFYGVEVAPEALRGVLLANPLTFVVEQYRQVLFLGHAPNLAGLAVYLLLALLFSVGSLFVFRRLHPSFADLV